MECGDEEEETMVIHYEGWNYVSSITYDDNSKWYKHTYDMNLTTGVQGKFNQIIYPLLNIWESFGDKDIQTWLFKFKELNFYLPNWWINI